MESALKPGRFIPEGAVGSFTSDLEEVASRLKNLVHTDARRATQFYETFLAGCYEKADEVDDSSNYLGMFVESLFCGWIKARQVARQDPEETVIWLMVRMDNDPYGFTYGLAPDAVKVMDSAVLAAFERQVKARFEASKERRRWGEVLRVVYVRQRDMAAYLALCEASELTPPDYLSIATILKARRKLDEALMWVERGLALSKKLPNSAVADLDLKALRLELLTKLGRGEEAIDQAWAEFLEFPSTFTYSKLVRLAPKHERAAWHAKAMAAAERAELDVFIELCLEEKEIERLVERLRRTGDAELEGPSHYSTEPAAKRLARPHPELAARLYRALGMRILNAKKSKYRGAALAHFANAKRCYERAGQSSAWQAVVAEVRGAHHRKVGFLEEFNRLVTGEGPREEPSFLERARSRWPPR